MKHFLIPVLFVLASCSAVSNSEVGSLKSDVQQLQTDVATLKEDFAMIKKTNAEVVAQVEDVRDQLNSLTLEIDRLNQTLNQGTVVTKVRR